jgi:oxygen-dependent protoporphyrinogen oxidase
MSTAEPAFDAIVVGAGLAGLAAAFRLKSRGFQRVVVLEASDRAGGCVRTLRRDGRLFETGPNSLRGHCPSISSLARAVGVLDSRLPASKAASERWIWLDGKRQRVPGGPRDLLTSTCLSPRTSARSMEIARQRHDHRGLHARSPW